MQTVGQKIPFIKREGLPFGAYSCRHAYSLEEMEWKHEMLSLYSEGEIESKPLIIDADHADHLTADEVKACSTRTATA